MKYQEALDIINRKKGYMVLFDVKEGIMLRSDYFPEKHAGESLIETVEEACDLAEKFAKATDGKVVNIYVVDNTFSSIKKL